jgi:hypothetical protein
MTSLHTSTRQILGTLVRKRPPTISRNVVPYWNNRNLLTGLSLLVNDRVLPQRRSIIYPSNTNDGTVPLVRYSLLNNHYNNHNHSIGLTVKSQYRFSSTTTSRRSDQEGTALDGSSSNPRNPDDVDSTNQEGEQTMTTSSSSSYFNSPDSRSAIRIAKTLGQHVWPNDGSAESRLHKQSVVFSIALMLAGKGVNIQVPYIFKSLVDSLSLEVDVVTTAAADVATTAAPVLFDATSIATASGVPILAMLLGYGMSRAAATGFQEWRNAVFATVAQQTIRTVGVKVFDHVHGLDLQFHLSKNTGKVARILDRGNRSINMVLNAMVFNVIPTIVEVGLVTGLVYYQFGTPHASVILATLVAYTGYTVGITQWRTQFRRDMNRLENEASVRVIDSLVNYETVQFFNNLPYEV